MNLAGSLLFAQGTQKGVRVKPWGRIADQFSTRLSIHNSGGQLHGITHRLQYYFRTKSVIPAASQIFLYRE